MTCSTVKKSTSILLFTYLLLTSLLTGCTSSYYQHSPYDAMSELANNADQYTGRELFHQLYLARSWVAYKHLGDDPIMLSARTETPIHHTQVKVIGTSHEDAIRSLAAKLWMIDNADHTLDLTYYIFKYDAAGYAILGALCNAVKRGVDIRIMVDSVGSINLDHSPIQALESCSENADYIQDLHGQPTGQKARVQFVIINALTSWRSWSNRRSHDKLIIKDGSIPGKDITITGGRNMSLDYYGINANGEPNPDTYIDLEIILRSKERALTNGVNTTVGDIASLYYSLLFLHQGNRRIKPILDDETDKAVFHDYGMWRRRAQNAYQQLIDSESLSASYATMGKYLSTDFSNTQARLAHELVNLTSTDVVASAQEIKANNANSIEGIMTAITSNPNNVTDVSGTFRIVSPYLFIPKYKGKNGQVNHDGAHKILAILKQHPNLNIEIITNSVLTSDNFYTQSVIDMDTAPRLLMDDVTLKQWLAMDETSENNQALVHNKHWQALIQQPNLRIYQTGKLDSHLLGGNTIYGKLHAKFFFSDDFGFVGTSNFDYRSRLYNSEMGFYLQSDGIMKALSQEFESLKEQSLLWGSPDWLNMRRQLIEKNGDKSYTSNTQRQRYKLMKATGTIWLF